MLTDLNQEPIVRHEAGEALGAIGDASVLPLLIKTRDEDKEPIVVDTCILAVERYGDASIHSHLCLQKLAIVASKVLGLQLHEKNVSTSGCYINRLFGQ